MKRIKNNSCQNVPYVSFGSSIPLSTSFGSTVKPDSLFSIIKDRIVFLGVSPTHQENEEQNGNEEKI